jgi:hypothetical protein
MVEEARRKGATEPEITFIQGGDKLKFDVSLQNEFVDLHKVGCLGMG